MTKTHAFLNANGGNAPLFAGEWCQICNSAVGETDGMHP